VKHRYFIVLTSLLLTNCKKNDHITLEPGLVENHTFNRTVLVDGHEYDGTIARNTIYQVRNHGIRYYSDHPGNGDDLLIENNMI
jgi:hypothetical protein